MTLTGFGKERLCIAILMSCVGVDEGVDYSHLADIFLSSVCVRKALVALMGVIFLLNTELPRDLSGCAMYARWCRQNIKSSGSNFVWVSAYTDRLGGPVPYYSLCLLLLCLQRPTKRIIHP